MGIDLHPHERSYRLIAQFILYILVNTTYNNNLFIKYLF